MVMGPAEPQYVSLSQLPGPPSAHVCVLRRRKGGRRDRNIKSSELLFLKQMDFSHFIILAPSPRTFQLSPL